MAKILLSPEDTGTDDRSPAFKKLTVHLPPLLGRCLHRGAVTEAFTNTELRKRRMVICDSGNQGRLSANVTSALDL